VINRACSSIATFQGWAFMEQGGDSGRKVRSGQNWFALAAVAGTFAFTATWLVLGFISPGFTIWGQHVAPYSVVSHPISGLGLGVTAPVMNAAFVLSGVLILSGVVATFQRIPELGKAERWTCIILLGLTPLGAIVDGIFTLEMMFPHLIGFLLAAATPVVSFLVAGIRLRRIPRWGGFANGLLVASPLTLALLITFFLMFDPTSAGQETGVSGLIQRVLVTEVLAWFAVMGWLGWRNPAESGKPSEDISRTDSALSQQAAAE
jgi:hypothetical protein